MAGLCRAGVVQPVGRNARGVDHPEQVLSSGWDEWMGMMAERLQAATAHLTPPFAVVDLDELDDNATSMIIRAAGLTIRLATKSIRCRAITNRVLGRRAARNEDRTMAE